MGAGLVVAPGDWRALAAAICQLSEDESLARRLGRNARKRAIERWDRQAILKYWTQEMFEICGSKVVNLIDNRHADEDVDLVPVRSMQADGKGKGSGCRESL